MSKAGLKSHSMMVVHDITPEQATRQGPCSIPAVVEKRPKMQTKLSFGQTKNYCMRSSMSVIDMIESFFQGLPDDKTKESVVGHGLLYHHLR